MKVSSILLSLALVFTFAATANAAGLTASKTTVMSGETITVTGTCAAEAANASAPMYLNTSTESTSLGNVTLDETGGITDASVTIPEGFVAEGGTDVEATLVLDCPNGDDNNIDTALTVTSATSPTGGVEAGGGGVSNMAWLGLAVLGLIASTILVLRGKSNQEV